MKTLYFDCFSGISGDMTIGALLDAGLDLQYLQAELAKLPIEGYQLKASRVTRANISAMKFDVLVNESAAEEHLHNDTVSHDLHHHAHDHGHHETHHEHHGSVHIHRKAAEILDMIRGSRLNANTRRIAEAIFTKLAVSEGKVHHIPPEDVEFHEVGAIDSIVDTIGSAIGFDALGIERFVCSPINVGSGFIHCQHGIYPVPAPATAELLRHATIYSRHANTELVTPTGAAILAAVVHEFVEFDGFAIEQIGYGAGSKQFQDFPNCLRLLIGEERRQAVRVHGRDGNDEIMVIEASIDDMTPQSLAYASDRLLDAGALDVVTVPIQMKKGRAGHLLQILAPINRWEQLMRLAFEETTTIGIRRHTVRRSVLERELVPVETIHGTIQIKVARLDGRIVNYTPEYEDCARIAQQNGIPLKQVQALALKRFLEGPGGTG